MMPDQSSAGGGVIAVLQARVNSSRLPAKVLQQVAGAPMLIRQIERVRWCRNLKRLVVATSTAPADDAVEELCREYGIDCARGSLDDVLDRFYVAASPYAPEYVVRLTGDCPLADPALIDVMVDFARDGQYDYASNVLSPSFPDGLDIEVVRWTCLQRAWREARLLSEREHVTPYFYKNPDLFRIGSYVGTRDLSMYRWTVDEPIDLELVQQLYQALYRPDRYFTTQDILDHLEQHPELKTLNTRHERNEGYARSLAKDGQAA